MKYYSICHSIFQILAVYFVHKIATKPACLYVMMQWTPITPMGTKRSCLGACSLEGLMFCCGGYDGASCLSSVERLDPLTGVWTSCPAMSTRRRYCRVAVLGMFYLLHCNENPIHVFLFWELRVLSPNFNIHVSVNDLYIPGIGPHIFLYSRIGRSTLGIYKSPPVLGRGAHSLARERLGESQFRRGDIHCGIYVLCVLYLVYR